MTSKCITCNNMELLEILNEIFIFKFLRFPPTVHRSTTGWHRWESLHMSQFSHRWPTVGYHGLSVRVCSCKLFSSFWGKLLIKLDLTQPTRTETLLSRKHIHDYLMKNLLKWIEVDEPLVISQDDCDYRSVFRRYAKDWFLEQTSLKPQGKVPRTPKNILI